MHKPVFSQSWIVSRSFVFKPRKLFIQALFRIFHEWRQWSKSLTQRWSTKINHWNSWFQAVGQNPMLHTFEPPIGQYLHFAYANANPTKSLKISLHQTSITIKDKEQNNSLLPVKSHQRWWKMSLHQEVLKSNYLLWEKFAILKCCWILKQKWFVGLCVLQIQSNC